MFQIKLSGVALKILKGGLRKGKNCLGRHTGMRHRECWEGSLGRGI